MLAVLLMGVWWLPDGWFAMVCATVSGIGGAVLVAVPFFAEQRLRGERDGIAATAAGNEGGASILRLLAGRTTAKLDRANPTWAGCALRGLILIGASYLFGFAAFALGR